MATLGEFYLEYVRTSNEAARRIAEAQAANEASDLAQREADEKQSALLVSLSNRPDPSKKVVVWNPNVKEFALIVPSPDGTACRIEPVENGDGQLEGA